MRSFMVLWTMFPNWWTQTECKNNRNCWFLYTVLQKATAIEERIKKLVENLLGEHKCTAHSWIWLDVVSLVGVNRKPRVCYFNVVKWHKTRFTCVNVCRRRRCRHRRCCHRFVLVMVERSYKTHQIKQQPKWKHMHTSKTWRNQNNKESKSTEKLRI